MEWLAPWRPIARRDNADDVLFAIEDGTGRVVDVHLTWTQSPPERAPWPIAIFYPSLEVWSRDGMRSEP